MKNSAATRSPSTGADSIAQPASALVKANSSPLVKARRVLANALAFALPPRSVFHLTGVIPPRLVSYEPFVTERYPAPVSFDEPPPPTAGANAEWSESKAQSFKLAHTVEVGHGIASALGHVCDRHGHMILGATQKYRPAAAQKRLRRSITLSAWRLPSRLPRKLDTVGVVTGGNQDQLWHWFFDIVPRLELLQRHAPADCPIYVDQRHSFQRDTLALFGIDPERILSANDTPLVRARRLIVPCYGVANGQRVPDSVRDLLRGRFLPKEPAAQAKKRIYVGRGDAAHRRIRNEEELLERLRPLGFEHHVLAELPLPDQVRLYRDAEIVIGGHGSGLAHLVFCDPGTTVIEFHPAASRDFYYRVSRAAGLRYYYVKARGGDRMDPDPEAYAIEQDDLFKTLALVGF